LPIGLAGFEGPLCGGEEERVVKKEKKKRTGKGKEVASDAQLQQAANQLRLALKIINR